MMRVSLPESISIMHKEKKFKKFCEAIVKREYKKASKYCLKFRDDIQSHLTLIDFSYAHSLEETKNKLLNPEILNDELERNHYSPQSMMQSINLLSSNSGQKINLLALNHDSVQGVFSEKTICSLDYFIFLLQRMRLDFFRHGLIESAKMRKRDEKLSSIKTDNEKGVYLCFFFLLDLIEKKLDIPFTLNMIRFLLDQFDSFDEIPEMWRQRWYIYIEGFRNGDSATNRLALDQLTILLQILNQKK